MVKVKKVRNNATLKPMKGHLNKSRSSVELQKSPKNRRKSLVAITPLKQQKLKKENEEWIVNEDAADATLASIPKNVKKVKKSVRTKVTERMDVLKTEDPKDKLHSFSFPKEKGKSKVILKDSIENLEKKFNIESTNVEKAVKGILKFRDTNPKLQNQLFDEECVPLFLQICCHKIPTGHSRILRINVPNSVLTPDSEICLIVPDVKGIKNIEHEKHVEHYEELLRKRGVENIKKIMTFHEFRTEYETFEQKSRLVDLYDVFLADGKISGKVVGKCGKIFYKKRKVPTSVKLNVTKLKEHITSALSKVLCHLHFKGDTYVVQFGHNKMNIKNLVENIFKILDHFSKEFPGGFNNIKGVQAYIPRAPSIPIYMSFKASNAITKAKSKSKKPKAYKSYEGELTTLLDANVVVRPSGQVLVTRTKDVTKDAEVVGRKDEVINGEDKKKKRKRKQTDVTDEVVKKKQRKIKEVNLNKGKKENPKDTSISENVETSIVKKAKKKKKSETNENGKVDQHEEGKKDGITNISKKIKHKSVIGKNINKTHSKKIKTVNDGAKKEKKRKTKDKFIN